MLNLKPICNVRKPLLWMVKLNRCASNQKRPLMRSFLYCLEWPPPFIKGGMRGILIISSLRGRSHSPLSHSLPEGERTYRIYSASAIKSALIPTVLKPASTYRISPVIPLAHGEHRNNAALPTSSIVTLRFNGATFSFRSSILRNDLIPEAAKVRIG